MALENTRLVAAIFSGIEIEAATAEHPNEMKFSGTLVRLDEPSTKPPNGSRGHKILIPMALAKAKVHTLKNQGVNYHADLDRHEPTKKVGVIKKAWIDGNAIKVSGIIWKRDFPDALTTLKKPNLGMSFEASDIDVEDQEAAVWRLSDLCFTGAAILQKDKAAYFKTEALAASAMSAKLITTTNGGVQMANVVNKKKKKTSDVAASGDGLDVKLLVKALTAANRPVLDAITNLAASIAEDRAERTVSATEAIIAKAKKATSKNDDEDDDDDDDEDDMDSAEDVDAEEDVTDVKAKKVTASVDEDEDMDASEDEDIDAGASDDEGELEDLDEESRHDDDQTGKINKKAIKVKKGAKTTVSTQNDHHKSVTAGSKELARVAAAVDGLVEANAAKDRTIAKLTRQVAAGRTALEAAGEKTDRRSITLSIPVQNLLAKEGLDVSTMSASGEKMLASEFDVAAAKSGLTINQRVAFKNELCRAGIMDEGAVAKA